MQAETPRDSPSTQLVEKKQMLRVSSGFSWVNSGERVCGSDSPVSDELSTWHHGHRWVPAGTGHCQAWLDLGQPRCCHASPGAHPVPVLVPTLYKSRHLNHTGLSAHIVLVPMSASCQP